MSGAAGMRMMQSPLVSRSVLLRAPKCFGGRVSGRDDATSSFRCARRAGRAEAGRALPPTQSVRPQ